MVKLEEVDDEEFVKEQPGPQDEDDWDTDDGTFELPNPPLAPGPTLLPSFPQVHSDAHRFSNISRAN